MGDFIYLATPIDQAHSQNDQSARALQEQMTQHGYVVYNPKDAWTVPADFPVRGFVEQVNREALSRAHALVAYLPNGAVSVGVPREIEAAIHQRIPVAVLINPGDRITWSLADVMVTPNIREILGWLAGLPQGSPPQRTIVFDLGQDGYEPIRPNSGDAGFDLFCSETTEVPPGEFVDIPTGIRVALPENIWLRITGRSSTLRRRGLLCAEGVIDSGYRGLLYGGVFNLTDAPVKVERGDRIIQAVPHANIAPLLRVGLAASREEFEAIPAVDKRGSAGFGSTGN